MPHDAFIQNRSPLSATAPARPRSLRVAPELALPRRTAPHGRTPANVSVTVRITDRESRPPARATPLPCALPPRPGWPGARPAVASPVARPGRWPSAWRDVPAPRPCRPATPGPGTGARLFHGFPMLVPPGPATRGPSPARRHGPGDSGGPEREDARAHAATRALEDRRAGGGRRDGRDRRGRRAETPEGGRKRPPAPGPKRTPGANAPGGSVGRAGSVLGGTPEPERCQRLPVIAGAGAEACARPGNMSWRWHWGVAPGRSLRRKPARGLTRVCRRRLWSGAARNM